MRPATLVVVDGPLRQHGHLRGTVGSIKTQHRAYGPPIVAETVGRLGAGERTPVFLIGERVPALRRGTCGCPGRCRIRSRAWCAARRPTSSRPADAVALADVVAATLPRFASEPHKDSRAPQNLYPIAGLERALRRRLGDQQLLIPGPSRAVSSEARRGPSGQPSAARQERKTWA